MSIEERNITGWVTELWRKLAWSQEDLSRRLGISYSIATVLKELLGDLNKYSIRLFGRISRILEPDGSLIIGSTESLATICPNLKSKRHLRSVYYQLKA